MRFELFSFGTIGLTGTLQPRRRNRSRQGTQALDESLDEVP